MVVGLLGAVSLSDFAPGGRMLVLPATLFLYYAIVWLCLGREPQRGSVEVRYDAPEELSPAALRYLRIGGTDGRSVAAVIARLAARGCARIEPGNGGYTLMRVDAADSAKKSLAPEEVRVLELLFEDGPITTVKPGEPLSRYVLAIESPLQKRLEGIYFTRHPGYIVVGILASMITALGMAVTAPSREAVPVTFLTMWFFSVRWAWGPWSREWCSRLGGGCYVDSAA